MKRCPTCNRTFTDQSLSFCTEDGTPLVKSEAPVSDPEATLVAPSGLSSAGSKRSDETASARGTADNWNAPPYQPPGHSAVPPGATKRRVWPWVVGIVVLLLIAVAGIGFAAVVVVPNMLRAAANENKANVNSSTEPNTNANQYANTNTDSNANSVLANANQNQNANENTNADANANANTDIPEEAPTDEDEVLADLTDLEKQWTEANFSADKKALARILADDYVGTQPDGTIQGKANYLRDIKPDRSVKDWELKDLNLTLKGDRATLKGKMRLQRGGDAEEIMVQFTDKFVWRDERWQAVASEVSQLNR